MNKERINLTILSFFVIIYLEKYYKKEGYNMKYKLINEPNKNFSTIQQILYNRGIAEDDILHYINLSD